MPRASGPDLPRRRVVPVAVGSAVLAVAAAAVTIAAAGTSPDVLGAITQPAVGVVAPSPTTEVDVVDLRFSAPLPAGSAATARAPEPR